MSNHWKNNSLLAATLVITTGVASAQPPLPKLPGTGAGNVKLETTQTYSGPRLPKPAGIVIQDFAVNYQDVELNRSALNQVRMAGAGVVAEDEQARVAERIAATFSGLLEKCLRSAGLSASRLAGQPPENVLAVRGYFRRIDEGDKLVRTGIGFGAGASAVQIHVELGLKQPSGDIMVSQFEAIASSGRRPGAALTMGVGAAPALAGAAAGAAGQKQDVDGDTNQLAQQISKRIVEVMKAQGWIME